MDDYARFAFLYDYIVGTSLRPIHADMVEAVCDRNGLRVVDLCCGTGLFVGLARQGGLLPTGVDISPDMLAEARRKHPSVEFVESDATTTSFPDHTFDAATVSFALHEKPAPVAFGILEEAVRITKPGGAIVVGDYRLPENGKSSFTGLGIAMVERLAGREHHACFREYMDAGGTETFLERAGLSARLIKAHMSGWAGTYVAERP